MRIALRKTLLVLVSALLSASVGAANVVITNSDGLTIAIKPATSVQFDASGNLNLECQTVSAGDNRCCVVTDTDSCVPLGSTQTPADTTPPTAPSGLSASAISDTAINLSWTASTDVGGSGVALYKVERCSGASCSNFAQITTTTSTSLSTSGLTASTSYSYRVRATDVAGNNSTYSNTATATTQSSGGTTACNITDPLIAPAGVPIVNRVWEQVFAIPYRSDYGCRWPWPNPTAPVAGVDCNINNTTSPPSPAITYPRSYSQPLPVGGVKTSILAIAIDPGSNVSVNMQWDPAQVANAIGYSSPRPAEAMLVTISPCAGDVRPINNQSSDPFQRGACRKFNGTDAIIYSTSATGSNVCSLTPGVRYYINVATFDTSSGSVGGHTCGSINATGCDVQMIHSPI